MKDLHAIIVGAGIGGLQTALALANDGHHVTVLESAKAFEQVRLHSRTLHRKPHCTELVLDLCSKDKVSLTLRWCTSTMTSHPSSYAQSNAFRSAPVSAFHPTP